MAQRVVQPTAAGVEVTERAGIVCAREIADGRGGALDIREEVQPAALAPRVAGQQIRGHERQAVFEPRTGVGEQRFEHGAHREHGRPAVDARAGVARTGGAGIAVRAATDHDLAQLAAGSGGALEHGDTAAGTREVDGRGEAAHPGADDEDATHGGVRPQAREAASVPSASRAGRRAAGRRATARR